MKPKLAVCPKTAVRSQMSINRECLFGPNFPRNGFWGRNFEILTPDSESAIPKYHVCQLSGKTDNFDFLAQICQKMNFGVKSRFGIRTYKIPCVPIFKQNGHFDFFLPKNGFTVGNSEN